MWAHKNTIRKSLKAKSKKKKTVWRAILQVATQDKTISSQCFYLAFAFPGFKLFNDYREIENLTYS